MRICGSCSSNGHNVCINLIVNRGRPDRTNCECECNVIDRNTIYKLVKEKDKYTSKPTDPLHTWKTGRGEIIPISNLATPHLQSIFIWFEEKLWPAREIVMSEIQQQVDLLTRSRTHSGSLIATYEMLIRYLSMYGNATSKAAKETYKGQYFRLVYPQYDNLVAEAKKRDI